MMVIFIDFTDGKVDLLDFIGETFINKFFLSIL